MIEVQLMSRMGNHFFQYAFAYATARQLGTSFKIRDWHQSPLRSLVRTPSISYSFLDRYYDIWKSRIKRKELISVINGQDFPLKDGVLYHGHYQSTDFFSDYESEIRDEFQFKQSVLKAFESKYKKLFSEKEVLCVHIRRSDYATVNLDYLGGGSLILPLAYYKKNIQELVGQDTIVFFVSDDIDYVEKEFSSEHPNYHFSKEDMFTDFLLLAHSHKVIIANSSFSWWAAYLNKRPDKQVIAPKYYLGFKVDQECPAGIMYSGFNWVEVPQSNSIP